MHTIVFSNLKCYGGTVTDRHFNRLVDALQSIALTPGVDYRILRTPAGTTIQPDGKGGGSGTCPFTIRLKVVDGDLKATLTPGSVNELVPTNTFEEFSVEDTGTYYVKAKATSDGEKITSVFLEIDTDMPEAQTPTPFALPALVEILLGIIKDGKAFRTVACGSIHLQGHEEFRTDKSPPAQPGELVYTPYYAWR